VNFVLDTNAVSETRKTRPNSEFMAWLEAQEPAHLFVTTITLGEAWLGFHRLPPNHSDYESIKRFITNLPRTYRVLNFDLRAAAIWGELTAGANGLLPMRDSFIGAIARSRGYRIVTRDAGPFERMGCKIINPWR
jgi:predicted nucleic acid-binding protein